MMWTPEGLRQAGFEGFASFADLPLSNVPNGAGVYVVLRLDLAEPLYLPLSPAGRFKQKNPSVSEQDLRSAWVAGAHVLYIGKASPGKSGTRGLRKRLDEYRRHGDGQRIGHWGGRYIWQLADSADLLVVWKATPERDAEDVESELLEDFVESFGRRPFANRKLGRSPR